MKLNKFDFEEVWAVSFYGPYCKKQDLVVILVFLYESWKITKMRFSQNSKNGLKLVWY